MTHSKILIAPMTLISKFTPQFQPLLCTLDYSRSPGDPFAFCPPASLLANIRHTCDRFLYPHPIGLISVEQLSGVRNPKTNRQLFAITPLDSFPASPNTLLRCNTILLLRCVILSWTFLPVVLLFKSPTLDLCASRTRSPTGQTLPTEI
jgi:hypothetical protein